MDEETAKMPCGHVMGRDGMTQFLRYLMNQHKYKIQCPGIKTNNKGCHAEWDFALCRKIGILTKE